MQTTPLVDGGSVVVYQQLPSPAIFMARRQSVRLWDEHRAMVARTIQSETRWQEVPNLCPFSWELMRRIIYPWSHPLSIQLGEE